MMQDTPLEQIEQFHRELQDIYNTGETRTLEWRRQQLYNLGLMVQENTEQFINALQADWSRPAFETLFAEINAMLEETAQACSSVSSWMKPDKPSVALQFKLLQPTIYKEPKGVPLIIGAWNFPLSLLVQPLIGALAAGCPTMLKPSELSPHVASLIAELAPKYLSDSVRVVLGAVEQTTKLLELKFDHILYTGSGNVGKIVATAAAKHLTPITLELGGKSPVVVFDDASADIAAKRIIWGKFLNAGQICIAPDYVLCTPAMQPKLIAGFQKAFKTFVGSEVNDILTTNEYCRIVNERHFDRVSKMLEATKGRVVVGGRKNVQERRIEPTVVVDCQPDDALMDSEIFGPILPVITMPTTADMIRFINSRDIPLALYVFTSTQSNFDLVRSRTRSGAILKNDVIMQGACPELPFGGHGESGSGAYHGKHSFDIFTHSRSSVSTPTWAEIALNVRYPPYTSSKTAALRKANKGHFKPGGKPPAESLISGGVLASTVLAAGAAALFYRSKL